MNRQAATPANSTKSARRLSQVNGRSSQKSETTVAVPSPAVNRLPGLMNCSRLLIKCVLADVDCTRKAMLEARQPTTTMAKMINGTNLRTNRVEARATTSKRADKPNSTTWSELVMKLR